MNYVFDSLGSPVSSQNEADWLDARRNGITASDARFLLKQNGDRRATRASIISAKLEPRHTVRTEAMVYGIEREPEIAKWVEKEFGIRHNTFLCHGLDARHLATPDGIGDRTICEIKSSTKTWHQNATRYRDQIQWQLHVTGADKCLLVKEDPHSHAIQYGWIARDQIRIRDLATDADELLFELGVARWSLGKESPASEPPEVDALNEGADLETDWGDFDDFDDFEKLLADFEGFDTEVAEPPHLKTVVLRDSRTWSRGETAELLTLYRDGMEIAELSRRFTVVAPGVVRELSAWLLVTDGELVNEDAVKFGQTWSSEDLDRLRHGYRASASIKDLADLLGRDQLGVAFRLFQLGIPKVSDRLITRLETRAQ